MRFVAEVFVVTDKVGGRADGDSEFGEPAPLMSWDSIIYLQNMGVRFGSHLTTHRPADTLSPEEVFYEGVKSRHVLEDRLNKAIRTVALPHGAGNDVVLRTLQGCGYAAQFGTVYGIANMKNDPMNFPRIVVEDSDGVGELSRKLKLFSAEQQLQDKRHEFWSVILNGARASDTGPVGPSTQSKSERHRERLDPDVGRCLGVI